MGPAGDAGLEKERRLPRAAPIKGLQVYRPRAPHLPFGGATAESLVLPLVLRRDLRRLRTERDIDLVHAHFGVPDAWAAARLTTRTRVPLIVSLWGSDVHVLVRSRPLRSMLSHALRKARHIIVPSGAIAERAMELGSSADRTSVVMGGVPDDYSRTSRVDARAALDIDPGVKLVVWVGNLVAVKGPLLALRAIAMVARGRPEVRLVLIGQGPLRAECLRTIRELRCEQVVRMPGALDSRTVSVWQTAADVVLNTSSSEALSFALAEALVCGTRVAAVAVGGIPELVSATRGGTLAEDSSPAAVAEAIECELELSADPELRDRSAFLLLRNVAPRIGAIYSRSLR